MKLSKTSKSEIGDSPKSRIRSLLSPKEWAARSLTVFIELQPRPDALTICLHRYTGPSGDFKFLYKCTHPRDITVTELKQSVSERLQVPATHLRLREIFEFSELQVTIKICRKPLLNGRVAEYFSSPEGVPVLIAVQELPEPDRITNMDLILRVVDIPKDLSFFSFADALAGMAEIVLPRTSTVNELRGQIAQQLHLSADLQNTVPVWKLDHSIRPIPGFSESLNTMTYPVVMQSVITEPPFNAVDGDTIAYRVPGKDLGATPTTTKTTRQLEKGVHITTEFDLPLPKRLAVEKQQPMDVSSGINAEASCALAPLPTVGDNSCSASDTGDLSLTGAAP